MYISVKLYFIFLSDWDPKMGRFGTERSDILILEIQKVRVNNHLRETLPYYSINVSIVHKNRVKLDIITLLLSC